MPTESLIEPTPSLLLTARDVQSLLKIGRQKLWEMTNAGTLPCVRIDRAVRYRRETIEQWIASREGTKR